MSDEERIDWSTCHCGRPADGHLNGYCAHCSSVRCDAYPGECLPIPPLWREAEPEGRMVADALAYVNPGEDL